MIARRRDAPDPTVNADARYRVELETGDGTIGVPCASGVYPHHSTLVPFVSAFQREGIRTGEVRLVDATDGRVVARRRLDTPLRRQPWPGGDGRYPRRKRFAMHEDHASSHQPATPPLAVSERAQSQLAHLRRRANLPPGVVIAIQPGEDAHPRFAAKRPDATDRVVAQQADGSPLLDVPAQAADALAGTLLDFVLTPEPGFVVLP